MSDFVNKMYFKGLAAKQKLVKLMTNERGEANIIAIILVLAIVIALAIVFRNAISKLFNTIWKGITDNVGGATNTLPTVGG